MLTGSTGGDRRRRFNDRASKGDVPSSRGININMPMEVYRMLKLAAKLEHRSMSNKAAMLIELGLRAELGQEDPTRLSERDVIHPRSPEDEVAWADIQHKIDLAKRLAAEEDHP